MKDEAYHVANFATFVTKTLTSPPPPPKKWMNLTSDRLSTASKKFWGDFKMDVIVVIEPRVVQFWSEIIRVISKQTHAMRLFDFEITRMISAQIALRSVQLPL